MLWTKSLLIKCTYHEGNGAPYLSFWNIPKYHRTLSERHNNTLIHRIIKHIPKYHRTLSERHNNTLIHRIIKHNYQLLITRSRDPWATSLNTQKGLVLHLKYRSPSHWMHCSVELLIGKVVLKKTIFPIAEGCGPSFEQICFSFTQGCFVPC